MQNGILLLLQKWRIRISTYIMLSCSTCHLYHNSDAREKLYVGAYVPNKIRLGEWPGTLGHALALGLSQGHAPKQGVCAWSCENPLHGVA